MDMMDEVAEFIGSGLMERIVLICGPQRVLKHYALNMEEFAKNEKECLAYLNEYKE